MRSAARTGVEAGNRAKPADDAVRSADRAAYVTPRRFPAGFFAVALRSTLGDY